MAQPEAKFKTAMREAFEKLYANQQFFNFAIVASMMQQPGVPDDYYAVGGRYVWVEAKADGGAFTPAQKIVIPQMAAAGLNVVILDADMKTVEEKRVISLSDFSGGVFRKDLLSFPWADMSTNFFWNTLFEKCKQ